MTRHDLRSELGVPTNIQAVSAAPGNTDTFDTNDEKGTHVLIMVNHDDDGTGTFNLALQESVDAAFTAPIVVGPVQTPLGTVKAVRGFIVTVARTERYLRIAWSGAAVPTLSVSAISYSPQGINLDAGPATDLTWVPDERDAQGTP